MDKQVLLTELLDLAGRLDIDVRQVYMTGEGGGLCKLRGRWVLFVDNAAPLPEQLARVAESLAGQDHLEDQYLLPEVREILEQYRNPK